MVIIWLIETNEIVRTGSSFASKHFKMPLATFCRTKRCDASLWWTLIRAIGFMDHQCQWCLQVLSLLSVFHLFFILFVGGVFDILIKASAYQICQAIFFTCPLYSTCLSSFLRLEVYFTATIAIHLFFGTTWTSDL